MLPQQSIYMLMTCSILIVSSKRIRRDSASNEVSPDLPETPESTTENVPETTDSPDPSNSTKKLLKLDSDLIAKQEMGFDLTDSEITKFKIWSGGNIPYFIDDFSFDKVLRDRIRTFLDIYTSMTGIQFIELQRPPEDTSGPRWVLIINRSGQLDCVDHPTSNFTDSGVQRVVLGYDCLHEAGDIAATIMALVGVPPQHNAPNRDEYIQVELNYIMPEKTDLFTPLSNSDWLFHELPYDYASASHYGSHAYTINGLATIIAKESLIEPIGEAKGLSELDLKKIKMLYNYIIYRKSSFKVGQCNKMFRPGKKFSEYQPREIEWGPRKKPALYTGEVPDLESKTDRKLRLKGPPGYSYYAGPGFNDRADPFHIMADYISDSERKRKK